MSECDVSQKNNGAASTRATRLSSVKIVGRLGYLNSDPAMPFMLPFGDWKPTELADQIMRACANYDITTTPENANGLALSVARQIIYETERGDFSIAD